MLALPRSQKELEIMISNVPKFIDPKPELEQYLTPPRIVASIVLRAFQLGDVFEKDVYDLCTGTGIFGKAALLMGARRVLGIDIDRKQLLQAKKWIGFKERNDLIQANVLFFEGKTLDTVFMNPPFGVQGKTRDTMFLKKALELGEVVYSLHLFTPKNRDFLIKWVENTGRAVSETITYEFELPRQFFFHKRARKITKILVLRIE